MVQVWHFRHEFADTPFGIRASLFKHPGERFVRPGQVVKYEFAIH